MLGEKEFMASFDPIGAAILSKLSEIEIAFMILNLSNCDPQLLGCEFSTAF
jgi:hypothetical protein